MGRGVRRRRNPFTEGLSGWAIVFGLGIAPLTVAWPIEAAEKRGATVADSIEMAVVTEPTENHSEAATSPDGRHCFIVVKKGNLRTGYNDYTLLLYDLDEVRRSLGTNGLPKTVSLANFSSASNRPGIFRARWLGDSRTISFIGEQPGTMPQLYSVDIHTAAIHQMTASDTPAVDYDISASGAHFVYIAESPVDWSERDQHGYLVGLDSLLDVVGRQNHGVNTPESIYVGRKGTRASRRLRVETNLWTRHLFGVWISPRGRWAIVPQHVLDPPSSWWTDYAPVATYRALQGADSRDVKSFSVSSQAIFLQFLLVDLTTGRTALLLESPAGIGFGGTQVGVQWTADESSVIVANTFLPLRDVTGEERSRRQASPSIVEVNLETKQLSRIVNVLEKADGESADRVYTGSRFNGRDELVVSWMSRTGGASQSAYRKRGAGWGEIGGQMPANPSRIQLAVTQSLNTPPEITASDTADGREKVITDLNPELRSVDLGEAEALEWVDEEERKWTGGLLRPPHYDPTRRYPLVILTHGFDPSLFWMDGPEGVPSGYAARALGGRGIVVLQVKDSVGTLGSRRELQIQLGGYEAAMRKLDGMGMIDLSRVGIHGWSRTGYYVQYALVFSGIPFAAASVADPSELGIGQYVALFGFGYPGMVEMERMLGTPLWGDEAAKVWAERDPTFHLDRVQTPLRIEAYKYGLSWWDMYAILRRHNRPVEYWLFPEASHVLFKPYERLTSQEGTVDWYDFWLNGHEDPVPGKQTQYARWRELRRSPSVPTNF